MFSVENEIGRIPLACYIFPFCMRERLKRHLTEGGEVIVAAGGLLETLRNSVKFRGDLGTN